ncbi:MAG: hypothetical protein FWC92_10210 [Defluviitaleaceae bacterium]|nr:hypothetical protein [Defluviitaleaceae bacterium]
MDTCGFSCEKMKISGCRYWKKHYTPLLEIIDTANFNVMSEEEALDVSKRLDKAVRSEWGVCADVFFRLPSVIGFAIDVGNNFGGNDKILENVIAILHFAARRSSETKMSIMYEFMFNHKEHKHKRIRRLIANTIPFFSEFDDYNEKWEYIMEIPKIAPQRDSINIFRWVLEDKLNQIPSELKPEIITIFDRHIEKFNPHQCTKCKIFSLISDIGDVRENSTCQKGAGCLYKAKAILN